MKVQVRDYERDMKIVIFREKGETFLKIANRLGISKARVRQLYKRIVADRENISKQMGIGA